LPTSANGSIVVENAWKRFRADQAKPHLSDQLAKFTRVLRGQKRAWRWVLKDINLEVEPGGTVGLIGINGSGKSTLLKCISRAMFQTAGRCDTYGRIGALLEVRGGIHPLLSGRENIYMFGSVLGLSRRDINARFDTIVEFAEVADAIDRQVKFYSSGMQVRLGFSIASHLDADILLVDEILAVGDANFQQKCLRRISEVVANGTTLLFVSHDLAAVEAMCERAMWLNDAMVRASGPTRDVLDQYRGSIEEQAVMTSESTSELRVLKVEVAGPDGGAVRSGEDATIRLMLSTPEGGAARFFVGVSQGTAMPIFVARQYHKFPTGDFELKVLLKNVPLPKGVFYVWLAVSGPEGLRATQPWKPVGSFDVFGPAAVEPPRGVMILSPVYVDATWELS
jgi:ABC-type polysaccharide/polyol phosphate transport system ATPase subunit